MTKLLSQEQVDQYHNSGFLSPVDVLNENEITQSLNEIESFEKETGKAIDFPHKSRCHQLFSWADYLVHHPKILDAVEDIIGPNILCYHATLWVKPAKSNSFVRWHQDGTYFFLDPAKHVTAWVALTVADEDAGCMQVIPGSHKNDFIDHNDDADPNNMIPRGTASDAFPALSSSCLGAPQTPVIALFIMNFCMIILWLDKSKYTFHFQIRQLVQSK